MSLTKPQQRMLEEVRRDGTRRYNGRARSRVEALAHAGLVTYEYDLLPQVKGNGTAFTELFVVRPVKDERS